MDPNDYTRLVIGRHPTGIMGLKQVLTGMSETHADRPDDEVTAELLKRLGKLNYITDSVRNDYGRAFLREFKKHIGKPVDAVESTYLEIRVLGAGCPSCEKLEQDVLSVLTELNMIADVAHIRDIREIGGFGVPGTPALIINGKVMASGHAPSRKEIRNWLRPTGHDSERDPRR